MFHLLQRCKTRNDASWWVDLSSLRWRWNLYYRVIRSQNSWLCSFMIDSIWVRDSTNLNIYLWSLWIFCRYDNFEYIAQLIILFVINNIIYEDICKYDEHLNVLRQIDHEFFWLCSISTDRTLILITFFWRIVCFRLSQISSITFRQRISFYSEMQLEFLHISNLSDWLFWLDRIRTILNVLSYHSILVRFVSSLFRLIRLSDACACFDHLIRR
jgi:hypothetical protein